MDRSSKSIRLALIGSAVFLSGCKAKNDEAERAAALKRQRECEIAKKEGRDCPPMTAQTGHVGGRGVGFVPIIIPGGRGGVAPSGGSTGSATSAASARGGFGATGAATSSAAS